MTKELDEAGSEQQGTAQERAEPSPEYSASEMMLGAGLLLGAVALVYVLFFSGPGKMSEAEWQEGANEVCSVVRQLTYEIIDQRKRGVRTEQVIMIQIAAASLQWPPETRPFLLEMARDITRLSSSYSEHSLLSYAWEHCQTTLRARTR